MTNSKPWDARIAYRLIYPLRNSALTPNHFTVFRLLVGVLAFIGLAQGGYFWSNIGAVCFALSNFLDHTDGEFARLTGKMTRFGHYFDLASDAAVNILLFLGIGIGLMHGKLGVYALPMGAAAGIAVAAIFHMRIFIEQNIGKEQARQPHYGGMEVEDVLYLLPLVAIFDQLTPFLILASFGAPLFSLWVLKEYLDLKKKLSA
ncbi:MAG: CDP-alcohol phosphatidyltransferase [Gammaproteobacteria bacterium]|nr:CDP-alcohol phosphatidyltransferase [Gammaproteobacteria bacterium]